MRAVEFLQEQIIDEVSMRPSVLRQEAAKTGALAGIEFEMIVPDAQTDDGDQEPDYDSDERVTDYDSIADFFSEGDINSSSDIRSMIEGLKEDYWMWASEHRDEQWASEGRDYFDEYVEDWFDENAAREEAEEEVKNEYGDKLDELTSEDFDRLVEELVNEKKQEWLDEEWEDQGRYYDRARESWEDSADWPDEQDYLRRQGYRYMSDIPHSDYGVYWPYYTSGGSTSIDEIADDFQNAIGKPVNASTSYHGARREAGTYVVEPDGSLDPDNSGDGGLEFVSPPLPIDEMLNDFNKVIEWAKQKGCYTNQSTGLHMNVSVPNFSRENCDYVKLALLLGDRYILEQFGRVANTYTKSALNKVVDNIKRNPQQAQGLLQQMKTNLYHSASKMVHSGITDKYTSINAHEGYIEFRSPGGDWLNANWSKLENTLLRFVVALDAACDPQKYRQDYLKKLYQVLQPESEADPVAMFAKFSAGELSKPELQQFIKQVQLKRQVEKQPPGTQQYWWRVGRPGYGAEAEVVASSKEEAIAIGKDEYPDWRNAQDMTAVPVRPYTPAQQNVNEEDVEEAESATPEARKISSTLKKAGYKQLGSGADATVWTKDVGSVIKIVMPESQDITQAAYTFKKFYEFCMQHQNLDCLPKFIPIQGQAFTEFTLGNKTYMQISMEQLYPIKRKTLAEGIVWFFSDYVTNNIAWDTVDKELHNPDIWASYGNNPNQYAQEWTDLDKQKRAEMALLYTVMQLLYKTGKINKMFWDLHTENAMQRKDGTIVIIDPWFERYSGTIR